MFQVSIGRGFGVGFDVAGRVVEAHAETFTLAAQAASSSAARCARIDAVTASPWGSGELPFSSTPMWFK